MLCYGRLVMTVVFYSLYLCCARVKEIYAYVPKEL
jgi:hypothetical protein